MIAKSPSTHSILVEIFQTIFNQTWDDADSHESALVSQVEDPACHALHGSAEPMTLTPKR